MNSKVIKLADLNQFRVNPEYKYINVAEEEIETILANMASNLGKTVIADTMEENCGVICTSEDGANVILYPSLQIQGAIQASKDVMNRSVGDTFTTVIRDKEVSLKVEKIIVNRPLAIDDGLAVSSAIEGVETLEDLRTYLKHREIDKQKEEKVRILFSEYMQYLIDKSEVEIDENEANEWAVPEAKRVYEEELSFGIDLRFTEEGDMLTLEETLEKLVLELQEQFKMVLIQEQFGKENGFVPSEVDKSTYDSFIFETLTARAREALS